ncbi:MAG: hypothetical protein Ct9H90mP6_12000 [Gammaproteobacteria bacterium]|nr:MAG: hypothetical protein Ct9H90mP6_12000 [Gammaproteobacteria bacterium]
MSVALGAEASFVARSIDMDRDLTADVLEAASKHKGSAFMRFIKTVTYLTIMLLNNLPQKKVVLQKGLI